MLKTIHFQLPNKSFPVELPQKLNNPFGEVIPEIVKIDTLEFQVFIIAESNN